MSKITVPETLTKFAKTAYAGNFARVTKVFNISLDIVKHEQIKLSFREAKILPYVMIGYNIRTPGIANEPIMGPYQISDFYVSDVGASRAREILRTHLNVRTGFVMNSTLCKILHDADYLEAVDDGGPYIAKLLFATLGATAATREHIVEILTKTPLHYKYSREVVDDMVNKLIATNYHP